MYVYMQNEIHRKCESNPSRRTGRVGFPRIDEVARACLEALIRTFNPESAPFPSAAKVAQD